MRNVLRFNAVADTFKRNFLIRKKTFERDKKDRSAARREKREQRIEAQKIISSIAPKGASKRVSGFLDALVKFAAFTFANLILSNLKTILPILSAAFTKLKEIAKGIKEFVTGVVEGLTNFYNGAAENIEKLQGFLGDIQKEVQNIGEIEILGTKLEELLVGMTRLATVLGSAKFFNDVFERLGIIRDPSRKGATEAEGTKKQKVLERQIKKRLPKPGQKISPARVQGASRRIPFQSPVAGAGKKMSGSGRLKVRSLVPMDDISARRPPPGRFPRASRGFTSGSKMTTGLLGKDIADMVSKQTKIFKGYSLSDLRSLARTMDDNTPFPMRKGLFEALKARGGLIDPQGRVVMREPKFPIPRPANRILDSIPNRFTAPSIPQKLPGLPFIDKVKKLAMRIGQAKIPGSGVLSKIPAPVFRKLMGALRVIGFGFLIAELTEDYNKGDIEAIIIKLTAFGLGFLVTSLGIAGGAALGVSGVGTVAGVAVLGGSVGAGAATEIGIRRMFLGDGKEPIKPVETSPPLSDKTAEEFDREFNVPKIKPQASTLNRSSGLDGETSYGQGSFVALRHNVIAIQPIEVPVG